MLVIRATSEVGCMIAVIVTASRRLSVFFGEIFGVPLGALRYGKRFVFVEKVLGCSKDIDGCGLYCDIVIC